MAHWLDRFRLQLGRHVERFPSAEAYKAEADWAVQKHRAAQRLLNPEHLRSARAREIYAALKEICLNVGALPFRITRIADANEAEGLRTGLCKLIETKGTAQDKMRAAALPQLGEATLTELLCLYAPHRFVMKNRPTMAGLGRLCQIYAEPDLRDMSYADYADLVAAMEKEHREAVLAKLRIEDFYLKHKCLLVCLFIARHGGKGKRVYA